MTRRGLPASRDTQGQGRAKKRHKSYNKIYVLDALHYAQCQIQKLKDGLKQSEVEQEEAKQRVCTATEDAYVGKGGGYNQLSLTSDRYHAANPTKSKDVYGFGSWKETKGYVRAFFELKHEEPTFARLNQKLMSFEEFLITLLWICLLYTSPSPRDGLLSRMPSSA